MAPKVLHKILEDGFFIDDEVSAEYFGGVLASSRVSQERDDRGAYWLSVLGRLSTFQIRAHCVLYMGLHSSLKQCPKPTEEFQKIMNAKKGLAINSSDLSHCLKLNGTEDDSGILAHVYSGLQRERLINDVQKTNGLPEMAVTFSEDGVALLLWAFGMGKKPLAAFLNNSLPWPNITSVISGSLVVPPRKGDAPVWG